MHEDHIQNQIPLPHFLFIESSQALLIHHDHSRLAQSSTPDGTRELKLKLNSNWNHSSFQIGSVPIGLQEPVHQRLMFNFNSTSDRNYEDHIHNSKPLSRNLPH